ncbi:MAG TPA: PQQ-binding-like beta-propeller repeat protein, partial [Ktedonobacteraceae bacterium]|nr:PQQ-binding-like beta-propeller repeat protein [Ktedonobacteraceae bacterium]
MSEQTRQQPLAPVPGRRTFLIRRRLILLVGLAFLLVAASVGLLTPLIPSLFRTTGASPSLASITNIAVPAMFGIDAQNTRVVPDEQRLTYANVSHLVADWTSLPTGGSIFSSPVVANGVVYVGSFDGRLYAFDAAGCGQARCAPLWMSAPTGDRIFATPAVANGVVYIGSYDRKLYTFRADGCGAFTCSPLWVSTPLGDAIDSSPTIANGTVYLGADDGKLYAFQAAGCGRTTCQPLWTTIASRPAVVSPPAVADGLVYVGTYDPVSGAGSLFAFNAGGCGKPACSPLWSATPGIYDDGYNAAPAISNGFVYAASLDGTLKAFNAKGCGRATCAPLWSASAGDFIESSPAVTGWVVYIGSWDHRVYA